MSEVLINLLAAAGGGLITTSIIWIIKEVVKHGKSIAVLQKGQKDIEDIKQDLQQLKLAQNRIENNISAILQQIPNLKHGV